MPEVTGADAFGIVRAGAERIDELRPLWEALHSHHRTVDPRLPGVPMREVGDTWPRRRSWYERWLSEPDAFVLIALAEGRPVGYALVHYEETDDSWVTTGERYGVLESLCVLPEHRGAGLGRRLMREVYRELRALGIGEVRLDVVVSNEAAMRFYDREGLGRWHVTFMGHIPDEA